MPTHHRMRRAPLIGVIVVSGLLGLAADAPADLPATPTDALTAMTHEGSFAVLPKFKTFSEWSSPVNVGAPVSTAYDESGPAISPDGRDLYFNRNTNGLD